jgi:hypothetical protein
MANTKGHMISNASLRDEDEACLCLQCLLPLLAVPREGFSGICLLPDLRVVSQSIRIAAVAMQDMTSPSFHPAEGDHIRAPLLVGDALRIRP